MGCRCRDIRKCQHDIRTLRSVVQQMRPVTSLYGSMQNTQNTIQMTEVQAYELNDTYRSNMQSKVQKNGLEVEQNIERYSVYITQRIDRLEHELRRMEREDDHYHSED